MNLEHVFVWMILCTPIVSGKTISTYYKMTFGNTAPLNMQCLLQDMRSQQSVGVQVSDVDQSCELQHYTWFGEGKPTQAGYTYIEVFESQQIFGTNERDEYLVEVFKPLPIGSYQTTHLLANTDALFSIAVFNRETLCKMSIFSPPPLITYSEMEILYRPSMSYSIEINLGDVLETEVEINVRNATATMIPYENATQNTAWVNTGDTFVYEGSESPVIKWIKYSKKM